MYLKAKISALLSCFVLAAILIGTVFTAEAYVAIKSSDSVNKFTAESDYAETTAQSTAPPETTAKTTEKTTAKTTEKTTESSTKTTAPKDTTDRQITTAAETEQAKTTQQAGTQQTLPDGSGEQGNVIQNTSPVSPPTGND